MTEKYELKVGNETLIISTGKMAKQADGAVTVQYGGTVVLVTACASKEVKEGQGFFPLTVEYQEKTYAAGKIPGGFFKREGRPSEKEILTSRLIDRPIRPLFPEGFLNEVQVVAIVLSHDGVNDSDVLAMVGASTALKISGIPFIAPIGAVRVGRVDGQFIVNPTYEQMDKGELNLVVAATREGVVMVEAGAKEVTEGLMQEAIDFGYNSLLPLIELQERFAKEYGKPAMKAELKEIDAALLEKVKEFSHAKLGEVCNLPKKEHREEAMDLLAKELVEKLAGEEESPHTEADVKNALEKVEKDFVRQHILKTSKRVDGRAFTEIREITCEVGVLPRTHGSGLFTRGQTQSLSVVTLGTSADEQIIDALEGESFKSFMLHYSFPPFSVGEVKPLRGPGRREIGHGALAERALEIILPSKEEFPYTIRVVSEILESNGSSSMATVCAGTLALMDAGVPIKDPVSGIAMGLIKEGDKFVVLTDIMGLEDHYGDMDFKVTGTKKGITALQLDVKLKSGINKQIIEKTLAEAKTARLFIMDKIIETISAPRQKISEFAPRIEIFKIHTDKIRDVIGPGGKVIKQIIAKTGATIDIQDDGTVTIASADGKKLEEAMAMVHALVEEPEVGKLYLGKVKKIMNFGVFVEILPGKEGLVHVSELADKFVKNVEDVVKLGDEFMVKLVEIDSQGRLNLSKKQAEGGAKPKERQ